MNQTEETHSQDTSSHTMRSRFLLPLCCAILLLNFVALGTIIAVFLSREWYQELIRFSQRVWASFFAQVGSTEPGFLSSFIVSLLTIAGTLVWVGLRRGQTQMLKHLREDSAIAVIVLTLAIPMVYGPQLIWQVASVARKDHRSLAEANSILSARETPKDIEIADLRDQLNSVCYRPDRHLTPEQRDSLFEKLKVLAQKYGHPRIEIGSFRGDQESSAYMSEVYEVFKDAGWKLGDPIQVEPPRDGIVSEFPECNGPLDISGEMDEQTPEHRTSREMAGDIATAFAYAKVRMDPYPVGPGSATRPQYTTVCVGYKPTR